MSLRLSCGLESAAAILSAALARCAGRKLGQPVDVGQRKVKRFLFGLAVLGKVFRFEHAIFQPRFEQIPLNLGGLRGIGCRKKTAPYKGLLASKR
jgi:hypothetical protein